jgi:peroxiredoxin
MSRGVTRPLLRRELLLLGAGLVWAPLAAASVSPYTRRGLLDQNGSDRSLAEVAAGKTLVLVVMKGHYCAVCRAQLARLEAISRRFRRLGARLAALNADPFEANRAIAEKYAFSMPILSDRDHAVSEGLRLWHAQAGHPMPAIVVFDACGSEVSRSVGRGLDDRPEAALIALVRGLHEQPPNCTVA